MGAVVLFLARYLMTRWFSSPMGRHTMAFTVVIVIVLGLAGSHQVWGDWDHRNWTRMVAYALINIVLWWRVALLFGGQRSGRR